MHVWTPDVIKVRDNAAFPCVIFGCVLIVGFSMNNVYTATVNMHLYRSHRAVEESVSVGVCAHAEIVGISSEKSPLE